MFSTFLASSCTSPILVVPISSIPFGFLASSGSWFSLASFLRAPISIFSSSSFFCSFCSSSLATGSSTTTVSGVGAEGFSSLIVSAIASSTTCLTIWESSNFFSPLNAAQWFSTLSVYSLTSFPEARYIFSPAPESRWISPDLTSLSASASAVLPQNLSVIHSFSSGASFFHFFPF